MGFYLAIKKNEIMTFAEKVDVTRKYYIYEVTKTWKDKDCIFWLGGSGTCL